MKLTQLDPGQIVKHAFDESKQANRVTLVDGLHINTDKIESAIKDAFKDVKINLSTPTLQPVATQSVQIQKIEVPVIVKEIQPLEVPVIIKEYEKVEVPVIIEKIQVVEIEKPIVVETTKVIEIEKQIVVKEQQIVEVKVPYVVTKYTDFPVWIKYAVSFYIGASLLLNLIALFKK